MGTITQEQIVTKLITLGELIGDVNTYSSFLKKFKRKYQITEIFTKSGKRTYSINNLQGDIEDKIGSAVFWDKDNDLIKDDTKVLNCFGINSIDKDIEQSYNRVTGTYKAIIKFKDGEITIETELN